MHTYAFHQHTHIHQSRFLSWWISKKESTTFLCFACFFHFLFLFPSISSRNERTSKSKALLLRENRRHSFTLTLSLSTYLRDSCSRILRRPLLSPFLQNYLWTTSYRAILIPSSHHHMPFPLPFFVFTRPTRATKCKSNYLFLSEQLIYYYDRLACHHTQLERVPTRETQTKNTHTHTTCTFFLSPN